MSHIRDAKLLHLSLIYEHVCHFNLCASCIRPDVTSTEQWFQVKFISSWINQRIRFYCGNKCCGGCDSGAALSLEESSTWQSRQCPRKTKRSKPHIRMWPIYYGYKLPSHSVQIILNGMTVTMQTQLSIAILSWGLDIEWMIISFSLLSLSLTCRNGQFMQAAPWPGKVDAPHRRKAAMFQTMEMNSGTTQGWFRSWATWN